MSQHTSPLQQPCSSSNEEAFVDLFADVSQHGSSLFELFSVSTTVPSSSSAPPSSFLSAPQPQSTDIPVQIPQRCLPTTSLNPNYSEKVAASYVPSSAMMYNPSAPSPPFPAPQPRSSTNPPVPTTSRRRSIRQNPKTSTAPNQPPHSTIAKPPHHKRSLQNKHVKPSSAIVSNPDSDDGSEASDDQASSLPWNARPPAPSSRKPPSSSQPQTSKQPPQLLSNADSSGQSEPPVKQAHNSHTRRCRAKVNSKFQELMQILPQPSTGIKHKAQILEYAIQIFRDYHSRKMSLEAELALSSRAHLNTWAEGVISRSLSLQDLLAPFLSLICTKGGWKYSEAWVSSQDIDTNMGTGLDTSGTSSHSQMLTPANSAIGPNSKLRLGLAVIPSLGNTDDPDLQSKLEHFRDKSRPYSCKVRVDLPGRILCTMRPEWLPSLEDTEVFQRARLAKDASLTMCFGVPVFIRGYVAAVAMFFDTEKRPYDAKCVDLADYVASLLGSSFGAAAGRRVQCR